jgi:hypothetical protein
VSTIEAPSLSSGSASWFAYMRVMPRLSYEMNRQLQTDSDLSLPD